MNYTDKTNFFNGNTPEQLLEKFGSPLYVYNEKILRSSIRTVKNMIDYKNFRINYSAKANSNLALLQIVLQEGLDVDALSMGEIFIEQKAGFKTEQIFFVSNNVSKEEMLYAIERGITVSVDSLSQLEQYGQINKGGKVAVRINPGVGAGHHEKVITGGKKTKFGINHDQVDNIKSLLAKYELTLVGINQHIGSLFMEKEPFIQGVHSLLAVAKQFDNLEFIDFGGGFGIPYRKQANELELNLKELGNEMKPILEKFVEEYGKEVIFKVEPGRYIPAESSVLLGTVHAKKDNAGINYIGTDIGFNVLLRPTMYDSHHDIEVYAKATPTHNEQVTIVGNICESGDILAKDRLLPNMEVGDVIGVMDAGSYGHSMSSNYNNRFRPAEVLIRENGEAVLIRRRDTFEDIENKYIPL